MKRLKQRLIETEQRLNINKQQLKASYTKLHTELAAWLRSPKTLGSAVLIGFIATYRGHARKHITNLAKRHLLSFPPLAAMPMFGTLWHFVPLLQSFLTRKKKNKK